MVPARSNSRKTGNPAPAALIEIVRLLARQAARELAEQPADDNKPKPTLSEDRS